MRNWSGKMSAVCLGATVVRAPPRKPLSRDLHSMHRIFSSSSTMACDASERRNASTQILSPPTAAPACARTRKWPEPGVDARSTARLPTPDDAAAPFCLIPISAATVTWGMRIHSCETRPEHLLGKAALALLVSRRASAPPCCVM